MNKSQYKFFVGMLTLNFGVALMFGFDAPLITYSADQESTSVTLLTLVTTHFSHHSSQHLFSNMAALSFLMILFPNKVSPLCRAFILCVLLTAIYASVLKIHSFLGFSALLYCLPGCYLMKSMTYRNHRLSLSILAILCIYLFIVVPFKSNEGDLWIPMTISHVIGFVTGFIAEFFCLNKEKTGLSYANEYKQL